MTFKKRLIDIRKGNESFSFASNAGVDFVLIDVIKMMDEARSEFPSMADFDEMVKGETPETYQKNYPHQVLLTMHLNNINEWKKEWLGEGG